MVKILPEKNGWEFQILKFCHADFVLLQRAFWGFPPTLSLRSSFGGQARQCNPCLIENG
jgi:hypothetical protein